MSETQPPYRAEDYAPPAGLGALGTRALVVGVLAGAATVAGAFADPAHFYPSYLSAWLLWYSVAAGCLGLMLLHHLSGGAWGILARRMFEAAGRSLWVIGLLAIPFLAGLDHLYPWTDSATVQGDPVLAHKASYLNDTAFILRTALSIVVFVGLAWFLSRKSAAQDAEGDHGHAASMGRWSSVGLLFFILANTFLAMDWLMSLDPRWFSSLYGGIFVAGQALAGLTFTIMMATWLLRFPTFGKVYGKRAFHDWGKLLFAFVMFFTYLGISQFIIAYQGNLPEEVAWFDERFHHGWGYVAWAVLVFHFFFPFLILLSRDFKKRPALLAAIAGFVLFMRWVDIFWQSRPALSEHGYGLSWMDLTATLGIGGIWFFFFTRELGKRTLLPIHDPAIGKAVGPQPLPEPYAKEAVPS